MKEFIQSPGKNNSQQSKEWTIEDYLDLALRRKFLILIIFAIVFTGVVIYILTRPDVYRATITFSLDDEMNTGLGSSQPYYYYYRQMSKPIEYYQAMMNSSLFYDKVIKSAAADSLLSMVTGFHIQDIIGQISLSKEEYSDLMYMSVTAHDSIAAWRVAVISSNAYKERAREIQEEKARRTVEYVNRQIALAEESLEKAERQLQEFQTRTKFSASSVDDGIIQRLNEIENKITEIETQRKLAEADFAVFDERLQEFKEGSGPSLLDIESTEVAELRKELGELQSRKNALEGGNASASQIAGLQRDIDAQKSRIRDKVLQLPATGGENTYITAEEHELTMYRQRRLDAELNLFTLKNQETYYKTLRDNYRQQHPNMLEHAIELARLQRAKTVNETMYSFLIQKGEEAKIQAATGTGGIKILSPPKMPRKPIAKKTTRHLLMGFIFGLGLGIGVAFLLDFFDKSVHSPEDIERNLGISVIGAIPNIAYASAKNKKYDKRLNLFRLGSNGHNGHKKSKDRVNERTYLLLPQLGSKNPLVEAYRNLRTDLQFVNVDEPIRRLLVTSPAPGEGKSLNTANLAISYAELGKRVLIVDCDMRKPVQHRLFNVNKMPGVSDFLARDLPLESIIVKTPIRHLNLIPAGTSPPNPAEMLDSHKMNQMVEQLDQLYDIVLYDSPPLIAVSDPKILAPKVKNVLLIVRAGKTNFRISQDALARLEKVDTKIIGAVLNGIGTKKGYGYYYRYNYYYNYDYYYRDSDKKSKKEKKPKTVDIKSKLFS